MVEPARFEWVTLALLGSIGVAAVGAMRKSYYFRALCGGLSNHAVCVVIYSKNKLFLAQTSYL